MESPVVPPLNEALAQLRHYGPGSSRGALWPVDQAVRDALEDPEAGRRIEMALLEALETASTDGRIYLLSQLTLVGTDNSVDPIAALLGHPQVADPARRALESLPGEEAVAALRARLPGLTGLAKAGVIQSLGRRRDAASVRDLARDLDHSDDAIVAAVLRALGRIASTEAAQVLHGYLDRSTPRLLPVARDAAREAVDTLRREGDARPADRLQAAVEGA